MHALAGLLGAALLAAPNAIVTLPAAASITGGAPFFSDVRVFNASYTAALDVTARYRCYVPSPCPAVGAPEVAFTLAPREARAFPDIVAAAFRAPDTAGAVEFEHSGPDAALVVGSRLFSTMPVPTVGMFVPGVPASGARKRTVLTSIRNGGTGAGFRTNVGVFNGGDSGVEVAFTVFDAGAPVGVPLLRTIAPHSGAQVSGVFAAAGAGGHATDDAIVTVAASGPVFSWAAVIDNAITDPIFVVGAPDADPPPDGPVRIVYVGRQGTQFTDAVEGGSVSRIPVGTTVEWIWEGGGHSTTSGACAPTCTADGLWNSGVISDGRFRFTFESPGRHPYFCDPHSDVMRGEVVVEPASAAEFTPPARRSGATSRRAPTDLPR